MSRLGQARAWVRALAMRRRLEREMHEEMGAHLAQAAERFRARGMSEREAQLAARREFGNIGVMQDVARDARGGQWLDNLITDLTYALRYFARTPLATVTIILTLGLGIGFSSAVFSVIIGIMTRPAPEVPDDAALLKIRGISNDRPFARRISYPELVAYSELTDQFSSVAAWTNGSVLFDGGDVDLDAVNAVAQFVTPNFFSTLGVRLAAGSGFAETRFEANSPPEYNAIVSSALATDRLGGTKEAIGKRVKVNDVMVTVVGVARRQFAGAIPYGEERMVWLPLSTWQSVLKLEGSPFTDLNAGVFEAVARMQPGLTANTVTPAVQVVAARKDQAVKAATGKGTTFTADVVRLRGPIDLTKRFGDEMGPLSVMFSAFAVMVLLVCTTTVNSLLVGAGVARGFEIGVRLALGAARERIVRQLLTEISILAFAGGALGLWLFGALLRITEIAQEGYNVAPDWRTATFTLLYSVLSAVLCGLSPALHATRTGLSDVMKDSSTGATKRSGLQRKFVVAQIALAQPLAVMLTALLTSVIGKVPTLSNIGLRERLLIADFSPVAAYANETSTTLRNLTQRFSGLSGIERVMPLGPGMRDVMLLGATPGGGGSRAVTAQAVAGVYDAPPGYFAAVGIPIVNGRDFVPADTSLATTPLIISDSLARMLFPSANPIGRTLIAIRGYGQISPEMVVIGVAGVIQETNSLGYGQMVAPIYVLLRDRFMERLLIRSAGPAQLLQPEVTRIARTEARRLPMREIGTLAHTDRSHAENRRRAFLATAGFGAIALSLSAIGLYALLNINVGQRRREIGIRIALGARAMEVVMMFFASGLRVAGRGLVFGVPLSIAGLAILSTRSRMSFDSVVAGCIVTSAVIVVASIASWLPARRAARVDPTIALRSE